MSPKLTRRASLGALSTVAALSGPAAIAVAMEAPRAMQAGETATQALADHVAAYLKADADYVQAGYEADILGDETPEIMAARDRMDAAWDRIVVSGEAIAKTPARNLHDIALKAKLMPKDIAMGMSDLETDIAHSMFADIAKLAGSEAAI